MAKVRRLKGRNVMVTGGAGFIGSELSHQLVDTGANLVVYDNFIYGEFGNLEDIRDEITVIDGDILSWRLYRAMKDYNIEYVFHLAAEPYIPHSYDNPEKFVDVNVKGTMNVLMAAKMQGVERIIHFSTSEVYGTAQKTPMDEEHATLPLSTYAVTKLAADRLCFVFSKEQQVPVVIIRPFNAYGPRETQPYVIPEMVSQLAKGPVIHLGNILAKRDFTFVEDTARGAIAAMNADIQPGELINLGSGRARSVREVAEELGMLMGHASIEILVDKNRLRPMDVSVLQCDYSKAKRVLGWCPSVDFRTGLKRTVDWFVANGKIWSWEKLPKSS